MNCALWLNKRKVRHASEIPENLDVASLRGYFLAGSLSEWLCENGGKSYAKKLKGLSADDPELNKKLARIFGGRADFGKAMDHAPRGFSGNVGAATNGIGSSFALQSSFAPRNSFVFTRFTGSIGFTGFTSFTGFAGGSFSYEELTSFGGFWEFLRKLRSGSFTFVGGSFGSYHQWEWLFELYKHWYGGSFTFQSGSFGSYRQWEWEWLFRLFGGGSFSAASFTGFTSFTGFGSFDLFGLLGLLGGKTMGSFEQLRLLSTLDEYDRIMYETLMFCPLDRFGYGIHNI